MKRFLFLFSILLSGSLSAQEFWDPADFEIGNRDFRPSLSDLSFGTEFSSNFSLPSGDLLNPMPQKKQVNMMAIIEEENNFQRREIDLGSPVPKRKKKKAVEFSGEARAYDRDDLRNNPFSNPYHLSNPGFRNHNRGSIYSPYSPYSRVNRFYY